MPSQFEALGASLPDEEKLAPSSGAWSAIPMSEPEQNDAKAKGTSGPKKPATPEELKPAKPKIGEGAGNLRGREAWYRKRSGSGEKAG